MPFYMCQFAYTSEAWTTMTKNPQDRSKPMGELAKKLGSRIVGLYYYLGDYDGILLFEAPDDVTANAVIVASMAPGHLKVTRTTRLFTPQETMEIMRKAGSVNFEAGPSAQWIDIYGQWDGWSRFMHQYLRSEEEAMNPLASPALASTLGGLPPALIITAEYDPLRDDGERYGNLLQEAGVPVTIARRPGAIHGFMVPTQRDAVIEEAAAALRTAFNVERATAGGSPHQ